MSKNFTTPIGAAGYSNLTRPDTKYDPDGVYKTSITVPADKAEKIIEKAKELAVDELGPKKASKATIPVKENEDGTVTIRLKTKNKPKLFDAKGNLIRNADELRVGGGSTIRAKGSMKAYENGSNIGISFYLNEVQIIKLQAGGGFEAVDDEDAYVADESAPVTSDSEGEPQEAAAGTVDF
jgi:PDZ domain-containing secreted protein